MTRKDPPQNPQEKPMSRAPAAAAKESRVSLSAATNSSARVEQPRQRLRASAGMSIRAPRPKGASSARATASMGTNKGWTHSWASTVPPSKEKR